ncbi:hypothetical protein [Jiella sonneratiae]|uniref:Uncharacterized protein n=1 Tax=Jiella sonneratiae TaxID=2816856 RepID=A0ABS3J9C9_9HYPH|nr:hypothetical protein [Jiella sonneratiae]MBO0906276.1 hypothetical protein [Jiella sonneratiae]
MTMREDFSFTNRYAGGSPPSFEESEAVNDPKHRRSYAATEMIRAANRPGSWMFTCRWRERQAGGLPQRRVKTLPYFHLGEIDTLGTEHLSLITTYSLIHMEGEGLDTIAGELARQRVEALQEFDPDLWDKPAPGAAVIARMWVEPLGKLAT